MRDGACNIANGHRNDNNVARNERYVAGDNRKVARYEGNGELNE